MTATNVRVQMQQRRDTAANWTAAGPTLLAGEIGYETDTGKIKIGDGVTAWASLAYLPIPDSTGELDDDLTITGDLTVQGTTTTIESTTLTIEDKNIELAVVDTPTDVTADGGGITLKGTTDKTINWIDATDAWTFSEHINIASAKEYRIDGTKVLDATSLGSAVVSSSLTSVGTISSGTWQGTAIDAAYLDGTVVTTGDTGTVTSTMIADGTIVNDDVNASAAIAGTKINPDFGSQTIETTGVINAGSGTEAAPSVSVGTTDNGLYSPGTDEVAFSTNGSERARIDSSGRLLVGTSSTTTGQLLTVQGSIGDATGIAKIARTDNSPAATASLGILDFSDSGHITSVRIKAQRDGGTWTSGSSQPSALTFSTTADGTSSLTERMRIDNNGRFSALNIYVATTAGGVNVNVNSSGRLQRSTSSAKYKTQIEDLQESYADAILGCRPVWYRSTCEEDNPEHGWWGFIAEEVAEIDPRLVHWKTTEITYDENGSAVETPCEPEPEGVAYDRFVPHLLNLIKRQKEQIETLEAKVAALESA